MSSSENLIYKVIISKSAANYIKKADRPTQERIATVIERIRTSPLKGLNIRPMVGTKNDYRYRIDNLRVVYTVNVAKKEVLIFSIGPRGDVYK